MKTFQQFNEDIQSLRRNLDTIERQNAPAEKLRQRRQIAADRSATAANKFAQSSRATSQAQQERHSQIRQDYEERQQELKAKREAEMRAREEARRAREAEREEQQEELQLEQVPSGKQTPFNIMKAKQQALGGPQHRRHVHGELARTAGREQTAKERRLKAIMSRESVENVDENVSSGSARRARFGVKQRVSSAEVITNTERQNQIAKHFADHAAKKKASGDEAHAAATKAGKSPMEAETARQRAHREYEKNLKNSR